MKEAQNYLLSGNKLDFTGYMIHVKKVGIT
jgi:hypothetical protein